MAVRRLGPSQLSLGPTVLQWPDKKEWHGPQGVIEVRSQQRPLGGDGLWGERVIIHSL